MNYLFYAEGYSEYNFIKHFLRNKNISFTKNFGEILNKGGYFLKNCQGDSNIFPSLKNDQWWIEELSEKSIIIIIADTGRIPCYAEFKMNTEKQLKELKINKRFRTINSKPEIEEVYLEDINFLKEVMKSYYNQYSIGEQKNQFEDLIGFQDLTESCDRHVIKTILKKNDVSMSKKRFSEKFFASAFQNHIKISIIKRINSIMDTTFSS